MKLHGFGVAGRQHQGRAGSECGANRTEHIGRLRALIVDGAGTRAFCGPAVGELGSSDPPASRPGTTPLWVCRARVSRGFPPRVGRSLWNGPPLPPGEIVLPETQTEERIMKIAIAVLGIDLGKNVCSVVGLDASGAVVLRRR